MEEVLLQASRSERALATLMRRSAALAAKYAFWSRSVLASKLRSWADAHNSAALKRQGQAR